MRRLLWGPVGGYYAERAAVPLKLVPLVKENAGPSTIYGITLGVRPERAAMEAPRSTS